MGTALRGPLYCMVNALCCTFGSVVPRITVLHTALGWHLSWRANTGHAHAMCTQMLICLWIRSRVLVPEQSEPVVSPSTLLTVDLVWNKNGKQHCHTVPGQTKLCFSSTLRNQQQLKKYFKFDLLNEELNSWPSGQTRAIWPNDANQHQTQNKWKKSRNKPKHTQIAPPNPNASTLSCLYDCTDHYHTWKNATNKRRQKRLGKKLNSKHSLHHIAIWHADCTHAGHENLCVRQFEQNKHATQPQNRKKKKTVGSNTTCTPQPDSAVASSCWNPDYKKPDTVFPLDPRISSMPRNLAFPAVGPLWSISRCLSFCLHAIVNGACSLFQRLLVTRCTELAVDETAAAQFRVALHLGWLFQICSSRPFWLWTKFVSNLNCAPH